MSISYCPDGRFLATASWDATVRIWAVGENGEIQGSNATTQVLVHADRLNSAAWSPDGRHLATGSHDSTVHIWAVVDESRGLAETNASQVLEGADPGGEILTVQYSPGGQFLAASQVLIVCVWRVDQDGKIDPASLQTLSDHTDTVFSVAWSRRAPPCVGLWRGQACAFHIWPVDANNGVVVPATGPQVLAGHTSAVMAADWHPDGSRLATVSRDSTVRICSVSEDDWDGSVVPPQVLDGRSSRLLAVAWSPDGNHLAIPSLEGQSNGISDVLAILGLLDISSMKQAVQGIDILDWTITDAHMLKPGFPLTMMDFSEASED